MAGGKTSRLRMRFEDRFLAKTLRRGEVLKANIWVRATEGFEVNVKC